ncbi:MAG: hypothetical protein R3344_09555 [Acidobacteriota bacterium]|nr:hypothetical protein [Acidobacteriota bacterium]
MLLVDCGNFSDNPTPEGDIKTRGLVEAMGQLGYRAANVAERDLAMGYDEFLQRTQDASFPLISTNFVRKDTGEPVFDPYTIVEVEREGMDPLRVGILGIVRFNPVFLKAGPEGTNVTIARPAEMINKYIDEVREASDLVILLAAVHHQDAGIIANEVKGIDFILGSYGAYSSYRDEIVGETRIFYSGNQGKRVGETRVFLDDSSGVKSTITYQHFLSAKYPGDLDMQRFVNEVVVKLNELKQGTSKTGGVATSG